MSKRAFLAVLVLVAKSFCQVSVEVKTSKPTYLVGEPVFVIVEVKNVGTESVGYSGCDGRIELTVKNTEKKTEPNLWGCFAGAAGGSLCSVDHPPLLAPGQAVTFQYLLKDYRLGPGNYELRAKGKAGVRWKYYPNMSPRAAPTRPPQHKEGDPVEGAEYDIFLPISIAAGSLEELQNAYAPYVEQADGNAKDVFAMQQAREAISEMAPEFLESTIAGFASPPRPDSWLAISGLEKLATQESRADLVKLYDGSDDPGLRTGVVAALAKIGAPDDLEFLAGLLPTGGTEAEDLLGQWAALGLGHIGGDFAAEALASGFNGSSEKVRHAIVLSLGNTRSKSAVTSLIEMYTDDGGLIGNDFCGALAELTHRQWCDGTGKSVRVEQARWRKWWRKHQADAEIHGTADCPGHLLDLESPDYSR